MDFDNMTIFIFFQKLIVFIVKLHNQIAHMDAPATKIAGSATAFYDLPGNMQELCVALSGLRCVRPPCRAWLKLHQSIRSQPNLMAIWMKNAHPEPADALVWAIKWAPEVIENILRDGDISADTVLHYTRHVVRNGRLDIVRLFLDHVKPNYDDVRELLRIAASHGHLEILMLLVHEYCNCNTEDNNIRICNTVSHAAEAGHVEIVRWLVQLLQERSVEWDTFADDAVAYAAKHDQVEVVRFLLDSGVAAPNVRALCTAVNNGSQNVVRLLVERGIFSKGVVDVLYDAAYFGSVLLVRTLLDHVCIHVVPEVLYYAARADSVDVVRLLLDRGVAPPGSHNARRALYQAVESDAYEVVRLLLEHGLTVADSHTIQEALCIAEAHIDDESEGHHEVVGLLRHEIAALRLRPIATADPPSLGVFYKPDELFDD